MYISVPIHVNSHALVLNFKLDDYNTDIKPNNINSKAMYVVQCDAFVNGSQQISSHSWF